MPDLKSWAADTGIRAVKTAAQTLVALFGAGQFNALHVDWQTDLAIAGGAGLVSILQNISSVPTPAAKVPVVVLPAAEIAKAPDLAPVVAEPVVVAPVTEPVAQTAT